MISEHGLKMLTANSRYGKMGSGAPEPVSAFPPNPGPWERLGWARLADGPDQNPDSLSDYLAPAHGCPECGSAWVLLLALGFEATRSFTGTATLSEGGRLWYIQPEAPRTVARAVRLQCWNEHTVEYDAHTRLSRLVETKGWALMAALGVFAIAGIMAGTLASGGGARKEV